MAHTCKIKQPAWQQIAGLTGLTIGLFTIAKTYNQFQDTGTLFSLTSGIPVRTVFSFDTGFAIGILLTVIGFIIVSQTSFFKNLVKTVSGR